MPEAVAQPLSAPEGALGRVIEGRAGGRDVTVLEAGQAGMISLRADLADASVATALDTALGLARPGSLGVSVAGDVSAVWMAPDELLLVLPHDRLGATLEALAGALAGTHHTLVDVSHARVRFRIEGEGAGELLAKGAPLDFRASAFAPGTARRTHLGQVAVGIWRESEATWWLVCFRSVADHVADWLAEGARPGAEVGHF